MLTKERLDAFMEGSETQFDTEMYGADGLVYNSHFFKRQVGIETFLISRTCYIMNHSNTHFIDLFAGEIFYPVLIYSPNRTPLFILDTGGACTTDRTLNADLTAMLNEWYADRRCDGDAAYRKLSQLYLDDLHQQYTDAEAISSVGISYADALAYLCTFTKRDVYRTVTSGADALPNLMETHDSATMYRNVYMDRSRVPVSGFDVFFSFATEDAYICSLYEEIKSSFGPQHMNPKSDPIMREWFYFLQAKHLWETEPLLRKYRDISEAVSSTDTKSVTLELHASDGSTFTKLVPREMFLDSLYDFKFAGSVLTSLSVKYKSTVIEIEEISSVLSHGKAVYTAHP